MTEHAQSLTDRDIDGLVFAAEMYGMQLDQLAVLLGMPAERARTVVSRWRGLGYAESARLGPGSPWIWVTRPGLAACGLPYRATPPALSRLAHIRAVISVRLALQATARYRQAGAYWRGERRLRAGCRAGLRDHLPDGEVHWPDEADVPFAGECWAIEAELTRKTVARTVAIMTGLLSRTGDYGCPAGEAVVPGRPFRHTRAVYVCSSAALATVVRARAELGPLAARVEIRDLPADAGFPGSARR